ncbi:imm11 family protein [Mesorhizobium sp. Cs1321R2N1]|uniref:imm11 family protein n=1 Tax=Mesorhizobium sp. Cs1321R2N1 TaxID=3015174 RepID=UPI00301D2A50
MKIYVLSVVEGQEWVLPHQPDDYQLFATLGGRSQKRWRSPRMKFLREQDDGTPRLYSDFPWLGEHVLILRGTALESLRPILEPYGEFLPLRADEPISLFNVTTVVDALDEERSGIVRFNDGGIMTIENLVLRAEAIAGAEIFKLPERADGVRRSDIYLQETIVRQIGDLGLKGIAFELAWNDETVGRDRIEYRGVKRRAPVSSARLLRSFWAGLLRKAGL